MTAPEPGRLDAATLAEGRRLLAGKNDGLIIRWQRWLMENGSALLAAAEDATQARTALVQYLCDADHPVLIAHELREVETRLRAELADARAALDQISELHSPWYEVNGLRHANTIPVYNPDEVPADHECITPSEVPFRVGCDPEEDSHEVLACSECRQTTEEGVVGLLFWPCPTAALAGPAGGQPS